MEMRKLEEGALDSLEPSAPNEKDSNILVC